MLCTKRVTARCCLLLLLMAIPATLAAWGEDGVPVCTANGDQNNESVVIVADGAGGAITVWEDMRSGESDIYAQRIDGHGTPLWTLNGVPVCTAPTAQSHPIAVPDGFGGAVIVWEDYRNYTDTDRRIELWAQRISGSGGTCWDVDGERIYTYPDEKNYHADITTDGNSGAIVVWERREVGQSRTFCQRIDQNGNKIWINPDTGEIYKDWEAKKVYGGGNNPKITTDGAGGAIIVYPGTEHIYVQRILSNGTTAWPYGGTPITTPIPGSSIHRGYPSLNSDGAGGAIITYTDDRSGDMDIYAQRIDSNHMPYWMENGVLVCGAEGDQLSPVISSDGAGGAIISWIDKRSDTYGDIYIRKITSGGVPYWPTDGVPICTVVGYQRNHSHIADGNKGAIVTWYDWRYGSWGIYAQRVNISGAVQWATDGLPIYITYGSDRKKSALISDGEGGAIIAWEDARNGDFDIYASRVTADGEWPVATFLESYSIAVNDGLITITWTLREAGEDLSFQILRAHSDGHFEEIESPIISSEGLCYTYTDTEAKPATPYRYRLNVSDGDGRKTLFETDPISIPSMVLALRQNHPNPFNPATTIEYYVPEDTQVKIDIYDIAGRRIACIIDEFKKRGIHTVGWNGLDSNGFPVCSGAYIYRIMAGKESLSRKMILVR